MEVSFNRADNNFIPGESDSQSTPSEQSQINDRLSEVWNRFSTSFGNLGAYYALSTASNVLKVGRTIYQLGFVALSVNALLRRSILPVSHPIVGIILSITIIVGIFDIALNRVGNYSLGQLIHYLDTRATHYSS